MQHTDSAFALEFKARIIHHWEESLRHVRLAFDQLEEHQTWTRPNTVSNSVGNLVLHIAGNLRQYAISSLGAREDVRQREQEFAVLGGKTKSELWEMLEATVTEAKAVLKACPESELLRVRPIQIFEMTGIGLLVHTTEHFSYHVGQIAFWVKLLQNKDLGFYSI